MTGTSEPARPVPRGDAQILRAAREELAERGYERTTMSAVAARAGASKASVYRRWWSKAELVIDAVAFSADLTLPDTGTLAGDLLMFTRESPWIRQALPGLVAELRDVPELAPALRDRLARPYVELTRALLERAVARGEMHPDVDLQLLAQVPAAMVAFRLLVSGQPLDQAFLESTCNELVVPVATAPLRDSDSPEVPEGLVAEEEAHRIDVR